MSDPSVRPQDYECPSCHAAKGVDCSAVRRGKRVTVETHKPRIQAMRNHTERPFRRPLPTIQPTTIRT
jgi:hypothetical protein